MWGQLHPYTLILFTLGIKHLKNSRTSLGEVGTRRDEVTIKMCAPMNVQLSNYADPH